MYKLIALDMDGTLLAHKGQISTENREAIADALAAGKHVVISTGRPSTDGSAYAKELGIRGPLVINNGSEIWSTPDELFKRQVLDAAAVARMLDFIQGYGKERVRFWSHTVSGRVNFSNLPDRIDSVEWLQVAVTTDEPDVLTEIRNELASWNVFEISNSATNNVECNAPGISKGSGLQEVCRLLGIDLSEAIAMGDGLNDVSMIRATGLGVAMGNGQDEVKRAADMVGPTNLEHGVSRIIREYLLAK